MQLSRVSTSLAIAALVAVATAVAPGCGNDAVGVEACRQIEDARCNRAVECSIPLAAPPHRGDDVAACVKFYRDECLHGLASKNDPGTTKVQACVQAIAAGFCSVVVAPESDPACAFLIPAPIPDAGSSADANDAASTNATDASTAD